MITGCLRYGMKGWGSKHAESHAEGAGTAVGVAGRTRDAGGFSFGERGDQGRGEGSGGQEMRETEQDGGKMNYELKKQPESDNSDSEEVVWIDIDDLGIDVHNVRGGKWIYDEEFIQDMKNNGFINPLLVRRADPSTGKKYAIICGSQRYNAAIEAGYDEVPCFIKEMDDVTAMGRSIAENKYSKDVPAWRYALKIGEMRELLDDGRGKEEIVKEIMEKTGLGRSSVQNYLEAAGLPWEIIALIKEPSECSEKEKELLKQMPSDGINKTLDFEVAVKMARELKGFPKEKMIEVAKDIIGVSRDKAFQIIETVKAYPKKSMGEIRDIVYEIRKDGWWQTEFRFKPHVARALDAACVREHIDKKELVMNCVEVWLKEHEYLKEAE